MDVHSISKDEEQNHQKRLGEANLTSSKRAVGFGLSPNLTSTVIIISRTGILYCDGLRD